MSSAAALLDILSQDVPYALRTLRKNPGFALTAIFTLALGIGGNTQLSSPSIRSVLLKPLAWRDPDRLVRVTIAGLFQAGRQDTYLSLPRYEHLREQSHSFTSFGAAFVTTEDMTLAGSATRGAQGARVSANFLTVLGADPLIGRSFLPEEDRRGGRAVALISSALWKRRFGSEPAISGKSAAINSTSYTIVGVLPTGFDFPLPDVDVWVPRPRGVLRASAPAWDIAPTLSGIARLGAPSHPGAGRAEAQRAAQRLLRSHPNLRDSDRAPPSASCGCGTNWSPTSADAVDPLGAVGFVLLIACANAPAFCSRAPLREPASSP